MRWPWQKDEAVEEVAEDEHLGVSRDVVDEANRRLAKLGSSEKLDLKPPQREDDTAVVDLAIEKLKACVSESAKTRVTAENLRRTASTYLLKPGSEESVKT